MRVGYLAVDESEELAHYGVLGMKWGVRNDETRRRYASEKSSRNKKKSDNVSKKAHSRFDTFGSRNVKKKVYGAQDKLYSRGLKDISKGKVPVKSLNRLDAIRAQGNYYTNMYKSMRLDKTSKSYSQAVKRGERLTNDLLSREVSGYTIEAKKTYRPAGVNQYGTTTQVHLEPGTKYKAKKIKS